MAGEVLGGWRGVDMEYNLYPVNEDSPTPDGKDVPMIEECSSGDIGYVPWTGQFHPNKPPGTTFLAVPAISLAHLPFRKVARTPIPTTGGR